MNDGDTAKDSNSNSVKSFCPSAVDSIVHPHDKQSSSSQWLRSS